MSNLPQDVEEFILRYRRQAKDCANLMVITEPEFKAWMTGHVRVPVETMQRLLQSVRDALEQAYNEVYPVCCGQAGQECCGSPDPEWPPHAMATMDVLGPIEKELSSMLNASKAVAN